MINVVDYIFLGLLGLAFGSFLNVCIMRMGSMECICYPPSHCMSCGKKIKWYDNIPVISYIVLRGKCRSCGSKISKVYPIIELISGLTMLGIGLALPNPLVTIYRYGIIFMLVVLFMSINKVKNYKVKWVLVGVTDVFFVLFRYILEHTGNVFIEPVYSTFIGLLESLCVVLLYYLLSGKDVKRTLYVFLINLLLVLNYDFISLASMYAVFAVLVIIGYCIEKIKKKKISYYIEVCGIGTVIFFDIIGNLILLRIIFGG